MYRKIGCYRDKKDFGNQLIVYKGKHDYFVVIEDRGEIAFYFVDNNIEKLYPANSYIKKTGFVYCEGIDVIDCFDIDLSSYGHSDCPEFLQKIIKNMTGSVESVTQLNQEDIDIIIDKVKMYFSKKGRSIEIFKSYENKDGSMQDKISNIELIANLCFIIEENGREPLTYKVPLSRMDYWERPYYFKVKKRQLIKFIKSTG